MRLFILLAAVFAAMWMLTPAQAEEAQAEGQEVDQTAPMSKAGGKVAEQTGQENKDAIDAAKLALADLEYRARQVDKAIASLIEEIERLRPNDLPAEARTIAKFRDVLSLVQVQGRKIAENERAFQSLAGLYKTALGKAPSAFKRAATEYQRLATEEQFPELATYYKQMATDAHRDGALFEKRAANFDHEIAQVTAKVSFVRATIKLAGVMVENLELTPHPDRAAQLAKFAEAIDLYIASFRKTVEQFRRFHEQRLFNPPAEKRGSTPLPPLNPVAPPGIDPTLPVLPKKSNAPKVGLNTDEFPSKFSPLTSYNKGLAAVDRGDYSKARAHFQAVLNCPEAPASLRQQARQGIAHVTLMTQAGG